MKVLVSDNLGEIGIQMFQQEEGLDVDVNVGLPPEELQEIIGNYDALVIRSATKVTEQLLASASNLKVVGRAGIGLDNVDIPAATKRGIVVMNTPGGNVITTAEHSIAMLMSLSRNIPQGTATLKDGKWEKKKLQGREVFGKTLGVLGFGRIGSIVADRAQGLKMRVIVHDPLVTPEQIEKSGFISATLRDLYRQSDYISIHVPKLKETTGFINKDAFDQMKDGVMLINCARGGIVNENDLYEAMLSGKVAGAALDVFEVEPPEDSPLFRLDRLVCTPHLGASTKEAQTNVAVAVASQIISYLKEGTITNAVNVPSITGDLLKKLGPFLSLGDRMGCLVAQLNKKPLKEVVIEYTGDFQGIDLSPVTTAILKGMLTPAVQDDVNFINAPVIAKERGIKVVEASSADSEDYINLITIHVVTTENRTTVAGTIYGKNEPRVVKIDNFRLELIPHGHLAVIQNLDKPGAIGSIGTTLGQHKINIGRMHVGQEENGEERNIIYLKTDTPIPDDVAEILRQLPMVRSVMTLEL
jgi:D-3-phosphoglycerate dehydrogenase